MSLKKHFWRIFFGWKTAIPEFFWRNVWVYLQHLGDKDLLPDVPSHLVRMVVGPPSLLLCFSRSRSSPPRLNKLVTWVADSAEAILYLIRTERKISSIAWSWKSEAVPTLRPSMVTSSTSSPNEKEIECDLSKDFILTRPGVNCAGVCSPLTKTV